MFALGLAMALAGCVEDARRLLKTESQVEAETPFTALSLRAAWVNAPGAVLVMQRGLRNGAEQRIGLRNLTTVPGDNIVYLRTRFTEGGTGRLRFEDFMRRIGGAPSPFQDFDPGALVTAEDEAGPYLWAEQRINDSTVCVIGLRRLPSGARQLPDGADVMDILLRNCLQGSAEQALAPLLAGSMGVVPGAGIGAGTSRMLSPLAAPGLD